MQWNNHQFASIKSRFTACTVLLLGVIVVLGGPAAVAAKATSPETPNERSVGADDSAKMRSPAATVRYLHASLIAAMKQGKSLGYAGRFKKLKPIIEETHDLAYIAQIALGSYWNQLDEKQRSTYVETFAQLTIATYAARFNSYSGERFKFESAQTVSPRQSVVRSQLIESDGGTVNFAYVLDKNGGHWRIVNIVVNGVSNLALKRAEYTDLFKRKGFQALVDRIKSRIAHYQGKN